VKTKLCNPGKRARPSGRGASETLDRKKGAKDGQKKMRRGPLKFFGAKARLDERGKQTGPEVTIPGPT